MARENQGLQIALIIAVMLTVVLGGMTYYLYRQYDDAVTRANASDADARTKDKAAKESARDVGEMKRILGVADTETVAKITSDTGLFKEDMTKFGQAYPPEVQFYHPLVEKMQASLDDKNKELKDAKTQIEERDKKIADFEAAKQPQIVSFQKASEAAAQDLAGERTKFNEDRTKITETETKIQADNAAIRKEKEAEKATYEGKVKGLTGQVEKLTSVVENQSDQIAKVTSTKIDPSTGQVRWVDPRIGKVWIDRGRADDLPRQITFSVYPVDVTDLSSAGARKASIEVTQVVGDHLAECRVLDDQITNPIIPGDRIHTPLWAPGEKRHFALAGFMDLYGDEKDHTQDVIDLIKMNDGVVDSWVDEKGNVQGAITVKTRFLVLGEAPSIAAKGEGEAPVSSAAVTSFTKIIDGAKRYGTQKLPLHDMLQRMGWKNVTQVVHFGTGANPKDFAPKPAPGAPKASAGTVSEIYKDRQPPTPTRPARTIDSDRPMTAPKVLDREFLGIRGRLIELAAALDRVDRAGGGVAGDPRWAQIRRSLELLAAGAAPRAEGIEKLFSLPYDEKPGTGKQS